VGLIPEACSEEAGTFGPVRLSTPRPTVRQGDPAGLGYHRCAGKPAMMTPKPGLVGACSGANRFTAFATEMSAVLDTTMPRSRHDSTWASWSLWWSVD
jgi:hypothetical protein